MQKNVRKTGRSRVLNWSFKLLVTLLLFWALYRQFSGKLAAVDGSLQLEDLSYPYLILVVLLMPANWLLEALKWRLFLADQHRLPLRQALRAVLSGLTFSLFTPNRTGDYIGRILAVKAEQNGPVVIATLAGNLCQLVVLLLLGWIGFIYYAPGILTISWQDYKVFLIIGALGTISLLFFILYIRSILSFALRQKKLRKYKDTLVQHAHLLEAFKKQTFFWALGLAVLRYGIYGTQYLWMLQACGIEVPTDMAYAGIATIFLVQTSIPLPPALGLLARGEIAILVWSPYSEDPLRILVASFGLFIINLALPSLIGLGAILKINILQSLGYEKTNN